MKKVLGAILIGIFAIGLTACQEKTEQKTEDTTKTEEQETTAIKTYSSSLGFKLDYNADVFDIEEYENGVNFMHKERSKDENAVPLTVSVKMITDQTEEELARDITSGDGIKNKIQEATEFGSAGYPATLITFTRSLEAGDVLATFYLVPYETGKVIQIEVGSKTDEDQLTSSYIEEMLGTFNIG